MAQGEMVEPEEDMAELENLRKELADYFCEDKTTFKLEECIKIFSTFCEKFQKAKQVELLNLELNLQILLISILIQLGSLFKKSILNLWSLFDSVLSSFILKNQSNEIL